MTHATMHTHTTIFKYNKSVKIHSYGYLFNWKAKKIFCTNKEIKLFFSIMMNVLSSCFFNFILNFFLLYIHCYMLGRILILYVHNILHNKIYCKEK